MFIIIIIINRLILYIYSEQYNERLYFVANGEWSIWNDWKLCEVNCIREDTTEGKQKRWRTCRGSKCSGDDMEERSCSKPEICKGVKTSL